MVPATPVAPAVVAGDRLPWGGSVRGTSRDLRVRGNLRIVAGHRRDDTGTDHNVDMASRPGVLFRERVLPGAGWWVIAAALVAMVAIAYGAALGTNLGVITGALLALAAALGLWFGSPVVTVDANGLRCGRARLPRAVMGQTTGLSGAELREARRGYGVPAAVYSVLPIWSPPSAVVITIDDPDDPHPAWLVATRRPRDLSAALSAIPDSTPGVC